MKETRHVILLTSQAQGCPFPRRREPQGYLVTDKRLPGSSPFFLPAACAWFPPTASTCAQEAGLKFSASSLSEGKHPSLFTASLTNPDSNGVSSLGVSEEEQLSPGRGQSSQPPVASPGLCHALPPRRYPLHGHTSPCLRDTPENQALARPPAMLSARCCLP